MGMLARKAAASPSPERVTLAAEIEARDGITARIAGLRGAVERAENARLAARNAVDAAEEALKEAPGIYARQLADQALGLTTEAPVTVKAARAVLADAQEHLEGARAAEIALRQQLTQSEQSLGYANDRVKRAATAVIAASPQVAALVDRVAALQREYLNAGLALEQLVRFGAVVLNTGEDRGRVATMTRAKHISDRWQLPPCNWPPIAEGEGQPGASPWRAALDALMTDALAPLPE